MSTHTIIHSYMVTSYMPVATRLPSKVMSDCSASMLGVYHLDIDGSLLAFGCTCKNHENHRKISKERERERERERSF